MLKGVYLRTKRHRLLMSRILKGRKFSRKHRENISKAKLGVLVSEEAKRSFRAVWRRPGYREKQIRLQRKAHPAGRKLPKHHIDAIRRSMNESYRRIQGRNSKKMWRDERYRKKMVPYLKILAGKPSKVQRFLWFRLRPFGFHLDFGVDIYHIDIAHPEERIAVEVDGEYWHKDSKKSDRRKSKLLRVWGWRLLRINAKELITLGGLKKWALLIRTKLA